MSFLPLLFIQLFVYYQNALKDTHFSPWYIITTYWVYVHIYFAQSVPTLAIGGPFCKVGVLLSPLTFQHFSLSGTARCSKLIFHCLPQPWSHFSKEFWFISLENYTCLSEHYESLNPTPITTPHPGVLSSVSLKDKQNGSFRNLCASVS